VTEENKKLFKSAIVAVLFVVILLASVIWIAFVTEDWFKDAM
jgi:membrane protein involved in colicin uptake|tara:strand:+ start:229 stop:354 length:126 start_codon:yes stop_codon:yes gene_type:complete